MKILFFGDIVGEVGIHGLSAILPKLRKEYEADFVIANGENASRGMGLTEVDYEALLEAGVDAITLGNHWDSKRQIHDYIDDADQLIRPINLLNYDHGVGSAIFEVNGFEVRVTNILGQAFMKQDVAAPYQKMMELFLEEGEDKIHIVDFHAESTSEKALFAHILDGRVSAVIGTHTHVQTNDPQIFPKGTGFLSDAGMCGAYGSVIGFDPELAIEKMLFGKDVRLTIDEEATPLVCFVYLEIDETTGKCLDIRPVSYIGGRLSNGEASI